MQGYTNEIKKAFEPLPQNHIIVANELYKTQMKRIPEKTFYKVIGRLAKDGTIVHLTKGIYYKPKQSKYGTIPISDKEISEHYMRNSKGVLVGYRMYNNKGITTQIGKNIDILSNNLTEAKKNIGNVRVEKINLDITNESIEVIEMLEILQNYENIQDLNEKKFCSYAAGFANAYTEKAVINVLEHRKYKKSTIAFLKRVLDTMNVSNELGEYLSELSDYAIPNVEGLNEFAQ